jgi:hypothetical protein
MDREIPGRYSGREPVSDRLSGERDILRAGTSGKLIEVEPHTCVRYIFQFGGFTNPLKIVSK